MALRSDTFEILRDCRALFLKHLGVLLHDSGLISVSAISAIQDGAGAYFDEVVSSKQRGSFADEVDGLTSSRITLLGEDELELGIRLDNLAAALFESTSGSLWKLHQRFVTLLRRPDLPKSENPAGPKSISHGLIAMFAAAGTSSLEQKLALLDRFEAHMRESLPGLYAELNDFLERGGIEPAQPSIVSAPENTSVQKNTPIKNENTLLALQQALVAHLPVSLAGTAAITTGGAAATLLNQTSLDQLMFRLEALERMGRFGSPVVSGSKSATEMLMPALFDEGETPNAPKTIRSAELGIPKTSAESLAIDTLAMIFEAIFDDPELPDALKAAISSLQIKLLKIAMKDSTLFTDKLHPVRQVLDRMGQAVLGLPLDVPARHPICRDIFDLASRLRSEPGSDKTNFELALTELDALIADHHRKMMVVAQAYLPLIEQLERRDEIAIQVRQAITKALESNPPELSRHFLEQTGRKVLLKVGLEHSVDSPQWLEQTSTIEGLIWSFLPKTASEDRKALAQRLPLILKVLKNSMESVGMPLVEQEAFLDGCFELQTQALRPHADTSSANPDTAIEASSLQTQPNEVRLDEIRDGQLHLSSLDFADIEAAPTRTSGYVTGDWLSFQKIDGDTAIGHVCYISPKSQRALLINPDAGLAIAIHPSILDRQLRDGNASVRSGHSLFDRAATRALRQTGQH